MAPLSRFRTVLLVLCALGTSAPPLAAQGSAVPEVLLRLDDVGMNHSVNTAIARVAESGLPFSVSVMFATPWYQEAVEILR
ncbi:MAG: ChbG/HpnK family deacetylase, partial [Gemmatimonadota bacterium]|nr:ChbG/HpnK family deacetylase [Gemmatimonadota bacterium]